MDFLSPISIDGGLTLGAGDTVTPPLTITSSAGVVLATPLAGAMEYDGTSLYFTPSSTRQTFAYLDSPAFINTPTAPTAAVDTNTTQIATTAFVVGQASASNPLMNGSVAIGTSLRYSREDHVHASDTSRAPLASPTFTGTVTMPAGTASVAPLKLTSGTNLTTPAAGTVEYDGTDLYFTPSTVRKTVAFTDSNITGAASNVTGTVAIANGGTGQTTAIAAFDALSPLTTLGDIIYHNGTDNVRLAGNTVNSKRFLIQTGTGTVSAAPSWGSIAAADLPTTTVSIGSYGNSTNVASFTVDAQGRLTAASNVAISLQASQIASGTLAVGVGGTGISSYTTGDLLYASASNILSKLPAVGEGSILVSKGVGVAPAWQTTLSRTLPDSTDPNAFTFNSTITKNNATSATMIGLRVNTTLNTGASNSNTIFDAFRIDVTETSITGITSRFFMRGFVGATEYFRMTTSGALTLGSFLNIAQGYVYIYGQAAGTDTTFASKLSTDTNSRFLIDTNGKMFWGSGGISSADTTLYRDSANLLRTNDAFLADGQIATLSSIGAYTTGDQLLRTYINNNGTIWFGDGAATQDVNLYRSAANVLKTDDTFAANNIQFPSTASLSTNANNLDDYEEGTWSPKIGAFRSSDSTDWEAQSYGTRVGTYQKVGNTVTITFVVQLGTNTVMLQSNNATTATGFGGTATTFSTVYIYGLPFTSQSTGTYSTQSEDIYFSYMNTASSRLVFIMPVNSTRLNLYRAGSATDIFSTALVPTQIFYDSANARGTLFYGQFQYYTTQ